MKVHHSPVDSSGTEAARGGVCWCLVTNSNWFGGVHGASMHITNFCSTGEGGEK